MNGDRLEMRAIQAVQARHQFVYDIESPHLHLSSEPPNATCNLLLDWEFKRGGLECVD